MTCTRWEVWTGPTVSFWLDGLAEGETVIVNPGDRVCFERMADGGSVLIDLERRGALQ